MNGLEQCKTHTLTKVDDIEKVRIEAKCLKFIAKGVNTYSYQSR